MPLPVPDKQRVIYVLLAILLPFGVNNFYAGYNSRAILQLILAVPAGVLTCGITYLVVWIWSIIEAITVTHDAKGRPML
jgi:TM2 domain-containing membrane protein YozV